ncbi:Tim44/TimA family putative adaptor protein [Entomobacter blattae]|uniref:Tim44-like domain protein n=1 Tax=Entomobacter blattae TaxID=2762277 RepID=A0A7H1NRV5_9PROT|nr:Tim44/TimA family putative adaptor protein [Entomobacter blattae]QNT78515.1 Tim44-like domain protein [Entomobacter blattae]
MNFSWDHFPIDIVILAAIAVFLIWRLRSVIGRNIGFGSLSSAPSPGKAAPSALLRPAPAALPVKVEKHIPAMESPPGQILLEIAQLEKGFTPASFLDGVEISFRRIVNAFAAGDLPVLKNSLVPAAYEVFSYAVIARNEAQETQKTELKAIQSLTITDARLEPAPEMGPDRGPDRGGVGKKALITVAIVSDQINMQHDKEQKVIAGIDAVTEIMDLWTFVRVLGSQTAPGSASWLLEETSNG